jgi:CDK inhibitor PHO81
MLHGQILGTEDSDTDSQLQQAALSGNLQVLKDWTQRLVQAPDARSRLTRAFLATVSEAPLEAVEVLLATGLVDVHAEDAINERNCLHEAAISGRESILQLGLSQGVDSSRMDVYGRLPLHYACMYGHVLMVQRLVEAHPPTINDLDHDSYTPLIHSIIRHQLNCVHQLLDSGARIDPATENEHAPLNLACQYGEVEICKLLLENGAILTTDAEGLYPQHLVARKGKDPRLLLLLEAYGADLNQRDKLYQWTPLFHAASEGVVECVKILLDKGADVSILDEKDLPAVYYAAWEGHLECMKLLNRADYGSTRASHAITEQARTGSSPSLNKGQLAESQADGIPDLSLPPPIIPFRRYGHNFLDSKTFILLTFDANGTEAIKFFNDSKYPAARLTVSSKSSDYIPRNVMIPIQEEFRAVTFQVDNPDSFTIDFDIYPSFGSKVIARTVALPNVFESRSNGPDRCILPLFDPRLRAIGRLSFAFQVIRPFQGIPLEISQFETYWKATSQLDTSPSTLITGSSLSGEYVQLFVQLTRDRVPVLYPSWSLEHHGVRCPVTQMSYEEFSAFRDPTASDHLKEEEPNSLVIKHQKSAISFLTLKEALSALHIGVKVLLQVIYPTSAEQDRNGYTSQHDINRFVDAILTVVFDHARQLRANSPDFMRSIVFASFNPSVCLALNWKQPNCTNGPNGQQHVLMILRSGIPLQRPRC